MLTLEILYAVLQGLPPDYLTFLDEIWSAFCRKIHWALQRGADRGNTHRRLEVLVKRGLAYKFYGKGGVCYLAISAPLPREARLEIHKFIREGLDFAASETATPTTPTMSQKSTTPTKPTTP